MPEAPLQQPTFELGAEARPTPSTEEAPSPRPWLSVLLAVYGVEPYLLECARSLLSQDLEGVEILFLDDASPDGSISILRGLEAAHPDRIRVLRHERNRGLAAARNTLLDAARGEYLWFIDSDDVAAPGSVERLRRIVGRHRPDLVTCDFRAFDSATGETWDGDEHVVTFRGRKGFSRDRDALVRGLFRAGKMHVWSKVVRRAVWPEGLRFPEGHVFEDLRVMPRLLLHIRSAYHTGEIWVHYRQRSDSILGSLTLPKIEDWMGALAGYRAELQGAEFAPSRRTHAAIAHHFAISWMGSGKLIEELAGPEADRWYRRYEALWESVCSWPMARLERWYWLSGRLKRARLWRRWRTRQARR